MLVQKTKCRATDLYIFLKPHYTIGLSIVCHRLIVFLVRNFILLIMWLLINLLLFCCKNTQNFIVVIVWNIYHLLFGIFYAMFISSYWQNHPLQTFTQLGMLFQIVCLTILLTPLLLIGKKIFWQPLNPIFMFKILKLNKT